MPARFPEAYPRVADRRSQKDNCAACDSRPFERPIARSRHACWRGQSRDSTKRHATRRIHESSPQMPRVPVSPGRPACSPARRRPGHPRIAPPAPSIRAPCKFTEKCVEYPGANFTIHPRTHERPGTFHRHGSRDGPQLLPRGTFRRSQLATRRLPDFFNLHASRNEQAFRFGFRIALRSFAQFGDFLVEARNLRLYLMQFAIRLSLRCGSFRNTCGDGLRVGAEKRAAVLCNQVGNPAKDDSEVDPAKKIARCESAGILRRAFGSQRRNRREEKSTERGWQERHGAPPHSHRGCQRGPHRASPRRAPLGPEGTPARIVSAISPASTALACSRCTRAASTSAASAFFAACNSCCAAERAALTDACRSSRTRRRTVSCSTKISPRAFRSASL